MKNIGCVSVHVGAQADDSVPCHVEGALTHVAGVGPTAGKLPPLLLLPITVKRPVEISTDSILLKVRIALLLLIIIIILIKLLYTYIYY